MGRDELKRLMPLALLFGLGACSNPLCTNETIVEVRSPDGDHRAVMFMRECGATTDFTTQVSVDPWFFQPIGNVFVADSYNGGKRGSWGGPWARIEWVSPSALRISFDKRARVFTRNNSAHGAKIFYEALDRL